MLLLPPLQLLRTSLLQQFQDLKDQSLHPLLLDLLLESFVLPQLLRLSLDPRVIPHHQEEVRQDLSHPSLQSEKVKLQLHVSQVAVRMPLPVLHHLILHL